MTNSGQECGKCINQIMAGNVKGFLTVCLQRVSEKVRLGFYYNAYTRLIPYPFEN